MAEKLLGNLKEKEKPGEISSPKRLLIEDEGPVRRPSANGLNLTVLILHSGRAGVEPAADEIALRGKESSGSDNEL